MALLEELPGSRGSTRMSGKVAFVPQESWVFSGTVRDNILFGEKYKNDRYEETVKACSLKTVSQLNHSCFEVSWSIMSNKLIPCRKSLRSKLVTCDFYKNCGMLNVAHPISENNDQVHRL